MTGLSTYQNYLFYTKNPAQTLQRTAADPTVSRASKYYAANIGKVKTADGFIADYQLFSYAMKAYGLQDFTYAKAFMKKVLTSDLTDPKSFVNSLTDARYKTFAQAFNFNKKGGLADSASVQSADQAEDTVSLFQKAKSTSKPVAVTLETSYIQGRLASLTSVAGLTGDARLLGDVLAAYGLDPHTSVNTVTSALESDTSDPKSFANRSGVAGLERLAQDFNFDSTGTATTRRLAQTQGSLAAMSAAYTTVAGTSTAAKAQAAAETSYVGTAIEKATSLDAIVNDPRIVKYIGTAFGEPKITASVLRDVLTSDPSDLKSKANALGTNYAAIAGAFEFTTKGLIAREPDATAQSRSGLASTQSGYLEQTIETKAGADDAGTQLALYFARKAPTLVNAYQILADPALLKVAQTLLNMPTTASSASIDLQAKRITSGIKLTDLRDPAKVNALVSRFSALYDLANPSTNQDNVATLFGSAAT